MTYEITCSTKEAADNTLLACLDNLKQETVFLKQVSPTVLRMFFADDLKDTPFAKNLIFMQGRRFGGKMVLISNSDNAT